MLALPVVALMVSLAGCKDDPPPPPEPVRSSSPGPASPSATPSPVSQQPAPPPAQPDNSGYSNYGFLETAERYYVNGDEDAPYCIFFSDDTVQDEYGAEGMFEARGSYIYIYFNGSHVGTLTIIDAYTLEDEESGVRWIREGGDGFVADDPEHQFRRFSRLQVLALPAPLRLQVYPFDVMVLRHGMGG
jgi:hypothetical protein